MPEELLPAWRAWWRLHEDRPWYGGGFGPMIPGRIPFAAVRDWCAFRNVPGPEVDVLDRLFRAMDEAFFEHHRAQQKPRKGA